MRRLAAVLIAGVGLLGACGSDDTGGAPEQATETSAAENHNAADVAFAQGMIPHHRQAIEMSEMAIERAESQEVKDLAAQIQAAQAPEIETMTGWLEDWGEEVPGEMGMDHGGDMSGMNGMMSEEQMSMLQSTSGAQFDELFLTMMREHHVGAIEMAEKELAEGQHPDAKELAQEIITAQQAEIEEFDRLLES